MFFLYFGRRLVLVAGCVVASSFLAGCMPTKGLFDAFTKSVSAAGVGLTGDVGIAEKIAYESKMSDASKSFLSQKRVAPEIKNQCATNADKEYVIAKTRKKTFEAIEAYVKGLEKVFENKVDFVIYAGYVNDAISGIESTGVTAYWPSSAAALTAYKNFGKPVLALAAKLANMAQDEAIAREVAKTAQTVDPWIQLAIGQMAEGLSSFDDTYLVQINNFGECEQERLSLIYADLSVNRKEMSETFEAYYAKLNTLKINLGVRADTAKLLKKVASSHHELANPRVDWKVTYENIKILAAEVTKFKEAIGAQTEIP